MIRALQARSVDHRRACVTQVMGMGIVGRSLAATLPLANEIRVEQHAGEGTHRSHAPPLLPCVHHKKPTEPQGVRAARADTAVMHVELQAPGRRMHYEHRMDGGSYTYRRPDNGCLETATTAWEGDRLVTLTQPSTPQVTCPPCCLVPIWPHHYHSRACDSLGLSPKP
jgi:hypothetical protein